ncbi:MAG: alpha/beta fold hydrolase [Pseudomonadota bacterium]|nr:alpha/beta fold hydrolase [Pseudomonadota bacterium]MDO7710334.1 alpha/beta fold hydrolase [Pseudomonadota bacterium]
MKLYYQTIGTGQPLIILHGLFGSSDNWQAVAKQLATHAQVITVDLRNHGRSPHSSQQTYALMVEDLAELFELLKLDKADIIGHSMGGKLAMSFSLHYPQRLRKLVVVDIAPKQYHDEHSAIFRALLALDLSLYTSRNEVNDALKTALPNKAVRQFLLMNLALNGAQLSWRINLQALYDNYSQLLAAVCEDETIMIPSCFIRGGQSDYVGDEDIDLIRTCFPYAELATIEQAGHWVHAEAPQQLLTKITEFLDYD